MNEHSKRFTADQPGLYRIQVQDRLRDEWSAWFDGMAISVEHDPAGNAVTTLTGSLPDQAALHGVLQRIRDLGLALLLVQLVHW